MAAGDIVNTAARLQSAAPVAGILVDDATYRSTDRTIEYRKAEPVDAKGKADPIQVWEALRPRAGSATRAAAWHAARGASAGAHPAPGDRGSDDPRTEATARNARRRTRNRQEPTGHELFQTTASGAFGPVYWHHGRSLPYGEGVTFWALAEIAKAQLGVLESDSPEQGQEKLHRAVVALVPEAPQAAWVERHLRPLAGLGAEETRAGDREEAFAAWRRFLEALAEKRPLVLVFDDLHWADEALLDFIDYLVDRATGAPILALCTARPELLARRPDWGGGKVNSSTLLLSPLSEGETTALLHALLGEVPLADDVQARLLEHAAGNPLYAEEFTRMLATRPSETVLPETVQGIIAARLDTLPREEKELLQDAAVMGRVFWLGALGPERRTQEDRLHLLERKEFVSRERRSSVAGEDEYAFCHALVREVAYEQIPRAQRAQKHRAVAEWIESLRRPEDNAEMVAHHYLSAVEFTRASGEPTEELAARARLALREAGDRAFSLHAFPAAAKLYSEALLLWPEGDPARPRILFLRAHALYLASDNAGVDALEQARDALLGEDEREAAAEVEALLASIWWFRGKRDHAAAHLERAADFIGDASASASNARVLGELARQRMLANELGEGIRVGREAAAMAEMLGLDEIQASALNTVGTARVYLGDEEGRADVERSIEIALAAGSREVVRGYVNLGALYLSAGNVPRATELYEEAAREAARFGDAIRLHGSRGDLADLAFHAGRWDEAHRLADAFIAECEAGSPHYSEVWARTARANMRMATGDQAEALDDETAALRIARAAKDPQTLVTAGGSAAHIYGELGRWEEADAVAAEVLSTVSL